MAQVRRAVGLTCYFMTQLRNSTQVRDFVLKSRMGEARYFEDQGVFYEFKEHGERDQRAAIELIVTDAWINRDDAHRAMKLSAVLDSFNTDFRDKQIATITQLINTGKPLALMELPGQTLK